MNVVQLQSAEWVIKRALSWGVVAALLALRSQAFAQGIVRYATCADSGTTCVINSWSDGGTPSPGDVIVVGLGINSSTIGVSSMTGLGGTTFSPVGGSSAPDGFATRFSDGTVAAGNTSAQLTITLKAESNFGVYAVEVSGILNKLDRGRTAVVSSDGTSSRISPGSLTTTNSKDFLLAFGTLCQGSCGGAATIPTLNGSTFTALGGVPLSFPNGFQLTGAYAVGAAGTYRPSWALTMGTDHWTSAMAAFKVKPVTSAPATAATPTPAPTVTISRPSAGQKISGIYTFAVSTNIRSIASVEFALGSKRLGIATSSPFRVAWNTGYASDGSYALQATGRDAYGNIVATAQQFFTINNNGVSLTVTSSTDLTQPVSGTVSFTLTGYDPLYYPAIWMVNLDGSALGRDVWTDHAGTNSNTVTTSIDTQFVPNGRHELYIGMYSDYWRSGNPNNKSWYDWRGGAEIVLNVNNGHYPMGLAANYLHLYLRPGGQATLSCRQLFTDGATGACAAPSYSTSDRTVITVSPSGLVTAGSNEGFATVTLTDRGKATYVRVWVRNSLGIPHFSGSGQMLNSYQSGSSLFVVSPFVLQPSDLETNARMLAEVQLTGINTLSRGFYLNPRNITYDYHTWQSSYDALIAPDWQFAANHGFHILATGDDVCRNIGSEAWDTLNWPSGQQAVRHAMQSLASSGVAISVDMVDEMSSMWGSTPTPPGFVGEPNSFTSVTCSTSSSGATTCRVTWPNNPVNSGRFPAGVKFALGGSVNPSLNTPPKRLYTATNITSSSFDFTPAGSVSGTFNSANDRGLQFVWWAGSEDGCPSPTCNPPVPNNALTTIRGWITSASSSVPISWPPLGEAGIDTFANWLGPGSVSDYASEYWISSKVRHT
ncbi:MAG: Ig-like domain-containing protein, partial [Candidatus Binataceae bacterium]